MNPRTRPIIVLVTLLANLILFLGLIGSLAAPAAATVRQEERSGQILTKSMQTLEDKAGNAWQVVFFKQTQTDRPPTINLRLVGFPGAVEFPHPQALKIAIHPGMTLTAADVFTDNSPAPNVGQYDLSEIIDRLESNSFWELEIPVAGEHSVELRIPYFVIQEWQTVAAS
jgi:hypothetical protein